MRCHIRARMCACASASPDQAWKGWLLREVDPDLLVTFQVRGLAGWWSVHVTPVTLTGKCSSHARQCVAPLVSLAPSLDTFVSTSVTRAGPRNPCQCFALPSWPAAQVRDTLGALRERFARLRLEGGGLLASRLTGQADDVQCRALQRSHAADPPSGCLVYGVHASDNIWPLPGPAADGSASPLTVTSVVQYNPNWVRPRAAWCRVVCCLLHGPLSQLAGLPVLVYL
jgi:hypothetical protein